MATVKPRFPIRRFDVFAEYHRLQNEARGMKEPVAKGRAIWAAKVVAGRRYGAAPPATSSREARGEGERRPEESDDEFRSVGGVLQTDETFDKEIVDRMGREFYESVFQPAIEDAFKDGKRYEDIRDTIRKEWK